MKPQRRLYFVLAVGFIVFFFWHICLYWSHTIYDMASSDLINYPPIRIYEPTGKQANITSMKTYRQGVLLCSVQRDEIFKNKINALGSSIPSLIQKPAIEFESLFTGNFTWLGFAYDNIKQQFIVQRIEGTRDKQTRKNIGHIGPKGYSVTYSPTLGTFGKPLLLPTPNTYTNPVSHPVFPLYDPAVRRFYRIELDAQPKHEAQYFYYIPSTDSIKITEGPVQNQPDWAPVQIDKQITGHDKYISNIDFLQIWWDPPAQYIYRFREGYAKQYPGVDPNTMPNPDITYSRKVAFDRVPRMGPLTNDFYVLHQNGRIDYLDGNTLSVVQCAGYLPEVGFYENSKSRRPFDMVDYKAEAFYDPNGLYAGMAVAAVSRDGFSMALSFHDKKGNLSAQDYPGGLPDELNTYQSVTTLMKQDQSGFLFLTIRYLLENLQSPLLRLLDIPTAKWISPKNRYNTLFVHPNSFIGLIKFDYTSLGFLLFLMAPSLIISTWLGIKARKKAGFLGYDELSRDAWFIIVLAFGIPAYLTFRLTSPKQRMVTCANCGNLRRVEFENCQACKRDWQITKALTTAPDWSVRDTAKPVADNKEKSEVS